MTPTVTLEKLYLSLAGYPRWNYPRNSKTRPRLLSLVHPPVRPGDPLTLELPAPTRRERWSWGGAVVPAVVCLAFFAIVTVDPRYFYVDDTESGAVGNWVQLGHLMREGQFPSLVLDQWMAGNYPVEGQGGLWNPVQIFINYIAPSVDDLALLATLVKLAFAIILGWGVYRVCLEYGARPYWAAVAGSAVPFAGFTLYFEYPSWVTSVIGMAWVVQAWASGIRYARGRSGPIPVFVFLYLAISVGYVHAALMAGVTVGGALMVGEYIRSPQWRTTVKLGLVGIAAAACGAITFLPGLLSSAVTWRTGEEGTFNDNFLTAPWSETLTASIPSSVSSIESWTGETTYAPITYIAWFAIPALAFIGWRKAQRSLRELVTPPLLLLAFILLFTAGPSDIGQIRWPARLLPFVAVFSLVLLGGVLLSRFGTLDKLRSRVTAAALIVFVLMIRASSSGPQYFIRHLTWAVVIIAVGALAIYLGRRYGAPGDRRSTDSHHRSGDSVSSDRVSPGAEQVVPADQPIRSQGELSGFPGHDPSARQSRADPNRRRNNRTPVDFAGVRKLRQGARSRLRQRVHPLSATPTSLRCCVWDSTGRRATTPTETCSGRMNTPVEPAQT